MKTTNRHLSLLTGLLVAFLAAAAFWLSFGTLRDLAVQQGISPMWPGCTRPSLMERLSSSASVWCR
ncbi:MAG: hypothetical protein IPL78_27230 [Chloroflexi bacterium]|nr:hypothetical protein [Chloroflexota bacterium]